MCASLLTSRFSSCPLRTRCPSGVGLIRQSYLKHWKDNTAVLVEFFFSFLLDMPTVEVLATVRWNTCSLTHLYYCSLIHSMPPRTLAEELIVYGKKSPSRLKHGLIAPSFASKYVQTFQFPIEGLSSGAL